MAITPTSVNNAITSAANAPFAGQTSNGSMIQNAVLGPQPTTPPAPITPTSIIGNGQIGPLAKPVAVVGTQSATNQANQIQQTANTPPAGVKAPTSYNEYYKNLTTGAGGQAPMDAATAAKVAIAVFPQTGANQIKSTTATVTPVAPVTTQTSTVNNPTTVDDHTANQIINGGKIMQYNTSTGVQELAMPGAAGYSTNNPATQPVSAEADAGGGISIRQMTDGTYQRWNTQTQSYAGGASKGDFDQAKLVENGRTALTNAQSGIYSASQQSQLDGLKQQFQALIDKQNVMNANATGGATIAQNMYGMGTSISGKGEITQVINDGAAKIADLNTKMASAIANMQDGFQKNDMDMVKSAYAIFSDGQQTIQKTIDSMNSKVQAAADKADLRIEQNVMTLNNKYSDLTGDNIITAGDTQQQINDKLKTSTIWQNTQSKQAALTTSAVNKASSTSMNLTTDEIATAAEQIELSGNPSTTLAGYGRGDSPNRQAIMKKVMDDIGSGKARPLGFSSVDMKFASNVATQNTLKYLGSLTGQNGRPGNLDELVRVSDSIGRTQFPPVNSAEFKALEAAGDPAVAEYAMVTTEVADQVAKILQGGGSGGTSDAKLAQANEMFNKTFNKDQVKAVATELKTLLENRKSSLIGENPFLQEYASHPTAQGGALPTTSTTGGGTVPTGDALYNF